MSIFPTGNDFTMHTLNQVRRKDMTQTKGTCYKVNKTWTTLCCNTIETVPLPIRIGSQALGTACDRGQAFPRCCTDSTGTGQMILNSTQLLCVHVNQSSLCTGYPYYDMQRSRPLFVDWCRRPHKQAARTFTL